MRPGALLQGLGGARRDTIRRVALNSFLFLIVISMSVAALSGVRGTEWRAFRPLLNSVGINQNWAVFAPDPRLQTIDFEAHVTLSDGSIRTWKVPHGGPWVSVYRDYRWAKWVEHVILDANRDQLWLPMAQWVARQFQEPDRHAVRVALVRRWYDVTPPGQPEPLPHEWREYTYFVLNLGAVVPGTAGR